MQGRLINLSPDVEAGTLTEREWNYVEYGLTAMLNEAVVTVNIVQREIDMTAKLGGLAGLIGSFGDVNKMADTVSAKFQEKLGKVQGSLAHMDQFADQLDQASSDIDAAIGQFSNLPPADPK